MCNIVTVMKYTKEANYLTMFTNLQSILVVLSFEIGCTWPLEVALILPKADLKRFVASF